MADHNLFEVIERARAGIEDAVHTLLSELEPFLIQQAVCLTSSCRLSPDWRHQSASDLLQETRLRIWKGITQFRGADDDEGMETCLRRWIIVVMERAFLDMLQAKRSLSSEGLSGNGHARQRHNGFIDLPTFVDIPSADPSPSRNLSLDERATRVRESLGRLANVEDRVIIEQHFFRDRSLREIAVELGMEYTKLRRRFHQALATLGRALEDV